MTAQNTFPKLKLRHHMIASGVGLALGVASFFFVWGIHLSNVASYHANLKEQVVERASSMRSRLEQNLNARLLLVDGLVAFVKSGSHLTSDSFKALAESMTVGRNDIRALELAPDAVVKFVYPLKKNKKAIGLDLRRLPGQTEAVMQTIRDRRFVLAGPVNLIQGGTGIIGRKPIFITDKSGQDYFWGFAIIVIDFDALIKKSDLKNDAEIGFALRGMDGKGAKGSVFVGENAAFKRKHVLIQNINLPNGTWQLATFPTQDYTGAYPNDKTYKMAAILTFFVMFFGGYTFMRLSFQRQLTHLNLLESEQKYRDIIETTNVISWELDLATWRYTYVSVHAKTLLGYPLKEWTQENFWVNHLHPQDREDAIAHFILKCKEGLDHDFEYRMIAADGTTVWLRDIATASSKPFETSVLRGMMLDITAIKTTEMALKDSQDRYARLLELTSDEYFVYSHDIEGMFQYVSPSVTNVLGYQEPEFMCHFSSYLTDNPVNIEAEKRTALSIKGVKQPPYEVEILHKNGDVMTLSVSENPVHNEKGDVVAVEGLARDITTQKQMDLALRQSEELFSIAFKSSPAAIAIVSTHGGIIFDVNKTWLTILGYDREEVLGKSIRDLKIWEVWNDRVHFVDQLIETGHIQNYEAEFYDKNGHKRNVVLAGEVTRIAKQKRLLISFYDITERIITEKKVKASLKEKEIMLQEIHHRVKNNLQVVSSMLSLQLGSEQNDHVIAALHESQRRVQVMARAHENLYGSNDLSCILAPKYLGAIVKDAQAGHMAEFAVGISFHVDVDDIRFEIEHALPVGQILSELLSNVYKHAFVNGENGSVYVSLKRQGDGKVELSVTDDGAGIPNDFSLENASTLGLKLVQALAMKLGGTIKTSCSKGTTFAIVFKENPL